MRFNKLIRPSVFVITGIILLGGKPIMRFNKLIQTPVGADLSRPAPIYRPWLPVPLSALFC